MTPLAQALLGQQQQAPNGPVPLASMAENPLTAGAPTMADAWTHNAQAIGDYIGQQRAISAERGLWNDQTGLPTMAGVQDAGGQLAQSLLMGTTAPSFRAYHGSPHSFDRFSTDKIGTGEGAQAYGHGLYFADREGTAQSYKTANQPGSVTYDGMGPLQIPAAQFDALPIDTRRALMFLKDETSVPTAIQNARNNGHHGIADEMERLAKSGRIADMPTNTGSMYEVQINANPEHFLDWDKPLSEQHPVVQDALRNMGVPDAAHVRGEQAYMHLSGNALQEREMLNKMMRDRAANGDTRDFSADRDRLTTLANPQAAAAADLQRAGIPGIRYLDGGSRGAGEGTSNHVVFDPETIEILRKYGIAGLMGGGTAAATTSGADTIDQP